MPKIISNEPTLYMTFYQRPNGKSFEVPINQINPEDKAFFLAAEITLSAEEDTTYPMSFILYGDTGLLDSEGEPIEEIVFSRGRSCPETMAELALKCARAGVRVSRAHTQRANGPESAC